MGNVVLTLQEFKSFVIQIDIELRVPGAATVPALQYGYRKGQYIKVVVRCWISSCLKWRVRYRVENEFCLSHPQKFLI